MLTRRVPKVELHGMLVHFLAGKIFVEARRGVFLKEKEIWIVNANYFFTQLL